MFENRRWLVIPTSLTGSIDFHEVLETSSESLRISIDGSKTFVKYDITEVTASYIEEYPDTENEGSFISHSVEAGVYGRPTFYSEEYPEYDYEGILNILETEEWTLPTLEA